MPEKKQKREKGEKRSLAEREKNYADIIELMFDHTQTEIAAKLGLTIVMVSRDIKTIQGRWAKTIEEGNKTHRARLQKTLETVRLKAINEYEASKGRRVKSKVKGKNERVDGNVTFIAGETETETETRNGDPRYLKIIVDTIEVEAKLLGANAPEKIEHSGKDGKPIEIVKVGMDVSEL